jgi:hypothetical protein
MFVPGYARRLNSRPLIVDKWFTRSPIGTIIPIRDSRYIQAVSPAAGKSSGRNNDLVA